MTRLAFAAWAKPLRWLDGAPLLSVIEPYRLRLFERFFTRDASGALTSNLMLAGRAKKNWKTADLVLAAMYCLTSEPTVGYDSDCSLLANDGDQAADDLTLAKKLVAANAFLQDWLKVKSTVIERKDGRGFLEILPAGDVVGSHGKSRRFVGYDELHGHRSWDVLEAMQPDPHRRDSQQWITSYASLFHRPGVPLFDLCRTGRAGSDPRMLFSWYAADFCTDANFEQATPEQRANPSMASWSDTGYLAQQLRRLPAHKYRRLHLNLPGLPEGSAYSAESVMDAVSRGIVVRAPQPDVVYAAFCDMSGGSSDDAVLGIGHRDTDGRLVLDALVDQGASPPFDPNKAVGRFARVLATYRCARVVGDAYAGATFRAQFEAAGISYQVSSRPKSQLYEAAEPLLNAHQVVLLDVSRLEQQLLGLVWRGGKIDHPNGEHDDYANAAVGVLVSLAAGIVCRCGDAECDGQPPWGLLNSPHVAAWYRRHSWALDPEDIEAAAREQQREVEVADNMLVRLRGQFECLLERVRAGAKSDAEQIAREMDGLAARAPASQRERVAAAMQAWEREMEEAIDVVAHV